MRFLSRTCVLGLFTGLILAADPTRADDEKKVELQVGDAAPKFEANDDQGLTWLSSDQVGKKYLVVYFYPGDFTPGCTNQARIVRDNRSKLAEAGIEIVGISGDSVETHMLFKKAEKLNFTLLADVDGKVAKQFGVPVGPGGEVKAKDAEGKLVTLKRDVTLGRWTFIIGKDGKILYKNTKVSPAADLKQVLTFIEKLEKKE
jgi:thioredoxin-dependent peroxiredoxin